MHCDGTEEKRCRVGTVGAKGLNPENVGWRGPAESVFCIFSFVGLELPLRERGLAAPKE